MRTSSCLVLVCVGLALASPARKLEKKSVTAKEALAPLEGLAAPADSLGDPIKEGASANVDRAKKSATTFCVEIRQNQASSINCPDAKPQSDPEPQPIPAPEPVTPKPAPEPVAPQPQQQPEQHSHVYYTPQSWEPTYTSYIVQPAGYHPYGANYLPSVPSMVQPQQPLVQPQQPLVQPQQTIVQPQQTIVQPQQPMSGPLPHFQVVRPLVQPQPFVMPVHHGFNLKPVIKPHALPHVPVAHQPNCPVPTGLQCTCSGSPMMPATLLAKDAAAGATANPSNEALALKFIQDLQKNAYSPSGASADSHLAGPATIVTNPAGSDPMRSAGQADPSAMDAKPAMMSPHAVHMQASVPFPKLAVHSPSGPGMVPMMSPSAGLYYDGGYGQHGVRLGREDSNAGKPEPADKDASPEEAPKPHTPFDAADDGTKNPRVARFLMDENEEAGNSLDEA